MKIRGKNCVASHLPLFVIVCPFTKIHCITFFFSMGCFLGVRNRISGVNRLHAQNFKIVPFPHGWHHRKKKKTKRLESTVGRFPFDNPFSVIFFLVMAGCWRKVFKKQNRDFAPSNCHT